MQPVLGITIDPDQTLELVAGMSFGTVWKGFELPGYLLADRKWDATLSSIQRQACHIRDILPSDVGRYLADTEAAARKLILDALIDQLKLTVDFGVSCCTLDLGIPRISHENRDAALTARVDLLNRLLPIADSLDVSLCLPQREPCSPPKAHFAEYATQLIAEVDHPACQLTLDVFPNEIRQLSVTELVQRSYSHIGVIRFFYEPGIGLRLDREQQLMWARALHLRRYDGLIVFCPLVEGLDQFCYEADLLASLVEEVWNQQGRDFDVLD